MTKRALRRSVLEMALPAITPRLFLLTALAVVCALVATSPAPLSAHPGHGSHYCPKGGDDPIKVSRLVDRRVRVARRMARRHNCVVRVVKRDGRALVVTDDLRYDRVNVVVRDRRIKRIYGVF